MIITIKVSNLQGALIARVARGHANLAKVTAEMTDREYAIAKPLFASLTNIRALHVGATLQIETTSDGVITWHG